MDKKGQAWLGGGVGGIVIAVIVILVIWNVYYAHPYKLDNITVDKLNLPSYSGQTNIYFDVVNNADTTLVGKVELQVNNDTNSCFYPVAEKELAQIQPKSSNNRYYVTLSTNNANQKPACIGKSFDITLRLKDSFGKVLDEKTISGIGIVQ